MNKKILIIEDSQTQLRSITLSLKKYGYDILSTTDGAEGIKLAYDHLPDLIISDIVMPEISGYQLCRLLKNDKLTKNIPIILLTSLNEKLDKFWGLRSGADTFIIKDSNFDNLKTQIDKFLNKKNTAKMGERRLSNDKFESLSIQSKINHLLDQSLIESTIVNEFKNLSEFVTNSEILIKGIFSLLSSILDYNIAGIFFNDTDDKRGKTIYLSIMDPDINKDTLSGITQEFFNKVFSGNINSGDYSFETIGSHDIKTTTGCNIDKYKSKIIIPITFEDKILGGFCLFSKYPKRYTNCNIDEYNSSKIFNTVFEELKLLMRIKWLYSETRYLSITDSLTGLYNRRYFQQALNREFARSKRYNSDLSLVMFDIDHFKNVNDQYGHQFGDKILTEISAIIKYSLRKTDYVARYGGEEFVAILPETNLSNTYIPVERIRKIIEMKDFMYGEIPLRITISIGITNLTPDIKTEQEFLALVDKALYKAKDNGRNRIELCQDINGK